jgi:hypothetical protein
MIVACATATLAGWAFEFQLGPSKKVMAQSFTRNAVVEFDEIFAGTKRVKLNEAFDAPDDWLSNVVLRVKNTSKKPIVYLEVNINFPETRASGAMMSYVMRFGQKPGIKGQDFANPLLIPALSTYDVRLSNFYPQIKQFVENRTELKNLSRQELEIGFVVFEDKTAWAAGDFFTQDPKDPTRYHNVGDKPAN